MVRFTTDCLAPRARVAIAASVAAVLFTACGGGGDSRADAPTDPAVTQAEADVTAAGGDTLPAVHAAARVRGRSDDAGRIRRVIVFGDSLSDVGTYRVGPIAQVGGGKFTTNPGPVWSETVGLLLGAPVTPFRVGFAGSSRILGGTGYAMGGARVAQQQGIGCDPDPLDVCRGALTIPVRRQIDDHLAAHGDRFERNDLVFVLAGANDIFFQLAEFQAKVVDGVPVQQASQEALAAVQQAAVDLVAEVRRIVGKGATRVVVLNVPEIADSPFGKAPLTAPVRPLIAGMVATFNGTIASGLSGSGGSAGSGAVLLDLYGEFRRVIENPGAYRVREIDVPACDAAKIATITQGRELGGSSLFCSRDTLVQPQAPLTYLFADSVHPSTLGHLIATRFVLVDLWRRGML